MGKGFKGKGFKDNRLFFFDFFLAGGGSSKARALKAKARAMSAPQTSTTHIAHANEILRMPAWFPTNTASVPDNCDSFVVVCDLITQAV